MRCSNLPPGWRTCRVLPYVWLTCSARRCSFWWVSSALKARRPGCWGTMDGRADFLSPVGCLPLQPWWLEGRLENTKHMFLFLMMIFFFCFIKKIAQKKLVVLSPDVFLSFHKANVGEAFKLPRMDMCKVLTSMARQLEISNVQSCWIMRWAIGSLIEDKHSELNGSNLLEHY